MVAALAALALVGAVAAARAAGEQPAAGGPELRVLTANMLLGGADAATLVELVRATPRWTCWPCRSSPRRRETALDRAGLADAAALPRQLDPEVGTTGSGALRPVPALRRRLPAQRRLRFTQAYATVTVPGAPPLRVESAHPAAP